MTGDPLLLLLNRRPASDPRGDPDAGGVDEEAEGDEAANKLLKLMHGIE